MKTQITALSAVALLALTACGPSEEEQALRDGFDCEDNESLEECGERVADEMLEDAPEPPSFDDATQEDDAEQANGTEEEEEGSEAEEVAALIEEENELFSEWFTTEVDSEEEAQIEARLDDIYDRLDEIWGIPETEDDLEDEVYDLAVTQYILDEGGDFSELLGVGLGPTASAENLESADTGGDAEIGEAVAISGWGEDIDIEQAGTITLNNVEVGFTNPECYDAPLNDHYVALNLTVEADADAYEEIAATVFNFYLIDDQNTMHRDEVQTMEAYSCQSASGALDWVPPGTNHTGYIILDTDLTEGTIVYEGVGEDVRWEF